MIVEILKQIQVKGVLFKNRVVMAPMVIFGVPAKNGVMGEKAIRHYLERARTGIGLMISQALTVTARIPFVGEAGVYAPEHTGYLGTIAAECHRYGTRFFAQLAYPGYDYRLGDTVMNLAEVELEEIKNDFVRAVRLCKLAGLDGVELHGAHGFFLNMIASPDANQRTDSYGGDLNGRLLLVRRIMEEIRELVDENFVVSYRMGWNDCLDTDIQTAQALEALGIEMLHISAGIPGERALELPRDIQYNDIVYTGSQLKGNVRIPVIVVNDIRTLNRGDYLVENGLADFVAYGKPFLADPDFMGSSLKNPDYEACLNCRECRWFTDGEKCPVKARVKR